MSYVVMFGLLALALGGAVVVMLYENSRLRARCDYAEAFMAWAAKSPVTLTQYQYLAMRTAKPQSDPERLKHAVLGMANEVGEISSTVKGHFYYNRPLDKQNLAEELGDLLWFLQLGCTAVGFNLADVASANVEKLRVRYPHLYSDEDANARADKVAA